MLLNQSYIDKCLGDTNKFKLNIDCIMNIKDYSVLIKEFGERLPHDLYFSHCGKVHKLKSIELEGKNTLNNKYPIEICYPYLRPMSSMTEEEKEEERKLWDIITKTRNDLHYLYADFLVSHHLDYRGLIEKGLALKASEEVYK